MVHFNHPTSYEDLYVFESAVVKWAASVGCLSRDGDVVGPFTVDQLIETAVGGDLYSLALDIRQQSKVTQIPATLPLDYHPDRALRVGGPSEFGSAVSRVFDMPELVAEVLDQYSALLYATLPTSLHSPPFPVPPSGWSSHLNLFAKVNVNCFYAAMKTLWAYLPSLDILTAVLSVSAGVLVLERWHTFLVGALIGRKCGHASIGGACVSLNS